LVDPRHHPHPVLPPPEFWSMVRFFPPGHNRVMVGSWHWQWALVTSWLTLGGNCFPPQDGFLVLSYYVFRSGPRLLVLPVSPPIQAEVSAFALAGSAAVV
jgi:hypothetical protein